MNFDLTEEQRLIRHTAREFAQKEVKPVAADMDRTDGPGPLNEFGHEQPRDEENQVGE